MAERVRFRPERPPPDQGTLGLAILLLLAGVLLLLRPWWGSRPPVGLPVEVTGQVAAPGVHVVHPPTLAAAVEAAGGAADGLPETPLHPGDAVWVGPDGVRVVPAGNPLLVALPVDVNVHGVDALVAVPGLPRGVAEGIVAARAARPFYALEELTRVDGIDRRDVEAWGPFLTVGDPGEPPPPPPVDLNADGPEGLERLPGVGPALAARIVAHREAHGPFPTVEALDAVPGVGPALVERVRPLVVVR